MHTYLYTALSSLLSSEELISLMKITELLPDHGDIIGLPHLLRDQVHLPRFLGFLSFTGQSIIHDLSYQCVDYHLFPVF